MFQSDLCGIMFNINDQRSNHFEIIARHVIVFFAKVSSSKKFTSMVLYRVHVFDRLEKARLKRLGLLLSNVEVTMTIILIFLLSHHD